MEAAITLPAGPNSGSGVGVSAGLLARLGGVMYARTVRILRDEAAAARCAELLFVRFVVHADGPALEERSRWTWIYRVATSHALRQLSDDARPGGPTAVSWAGSSPLPEMRTLRRLDEAAQSMVVLSALDGLPVDEIAEVLGLSAKLVQRRLESSGQTAPADRSHPSMLALERDRGVHAAHLAVCGQCRAASEESDRLAGHFARELAPSAVARVGAAVREERARRTRGPKWKRIAWLGGGFAVVAALALLVARPRVQDRGDIPYAGVKGASRTKASGIQISVGRGAEIRALEPTAALRPGDHLFFRVKAERPRYLAVRVQDARSERRIYPVDGPQAVLVKPGQTLDVDYVTEAPTPVAPAAGTAATAPPPTTTTWIIGLFADQPFPVDQPPGPDVEIVPVRVHVETAAAPNR